MAGAPTVAVSNQPLSPVPAVRSAADTATGQRALAAGDLAVAKTAFSAALSKDPSDAGAALGLAEAHMALNEVQAARQIYQALVSKAPQLSARVNQGLGLIALRSGRADQAVRYLGKSVQQDNGLWRAWLGLGQAHDRLNQPSAARRAFTAAERVAPARAPVLNDLGMSYVSQKQPQRALEFFERALAMDPGFEIARANVRIAKAMTGQYEDAISGAPQMQLPDVLNNVGYIAILNKDFQVADRYLRRAIDLSPVYHQAAIANLDLLGRMAGAEDSRRKTAEADIADDAQIVLAPAAERRDLGPIPSEIETADTTSRAGDRVAAAATRQARRADDLGSLARPRVEPIGASTPDEQQTPANRTPDRKFNWYDVAAPNTTPQKTQKQAEAEPAANTDRTFAWVDPAVQAGASDRPEAPLTEAPSDTAQQSTSDRTFKWKDPAADESIETADLPPVTNKPAREDKRAFNWQVPGTAIDADDPHESDAKDTAVEEPIETRELRAPLLVDGVEGQSGSNQKVVTIIPPAETSAELPRRFNWSEPPQD